MARALSPIRARERSAGDLPARRPAGRRFSRCPSSSRLVASPRSSASRLLAVVIVRLPARIPARLWRNASRSRWSRVRRTPSRICCRPAMPCRRWSLPLGLPGLGAHFRIDALAAFFLAVVNLGGALTSLYGLGYGRHEPSPCAGSAVLSRSFSPRMNLVVLADDAFTFLLSWEFMSLASWAIVVAHHEVPANARAGYHLSAHGELRHAVPAAGVRPAGRAATATTPSPPSAPRDHAPVIAGLALRARARSAPDRRPAWCRCTSGCRSRIRRRRAMCRRCSAA